VDPQKGRPLTFYEKRISKLLRAELPFMAMEAVLMETVKRGYDRQEMHELIKKHAVAAGLAIKEKGAENDLFERLGQDQAFPLAKKELGKFIGHPAHYTGFAQQQTEEYLKKTVEPCLKKYRKRLGKTTTRLRV
jgi:adenylosuccinate lyase